MLLHGRGGGHAVEQFELAAGPLDDLTAGLVVAGQHAAQHDEVGAGAERLGHVTGAGAAAVLQTGRPQRGRGRSAQLYWRGRVKHEDIAR